MNPQTQTEETLQDVFFQPCEGEELKVQEWRLEQFRSLGMSTLPALQCTIGKVDTHRARAYVADGCPPDLAAEILL